MKLCQIPSKVSRNSLNTEFESFDQSFSTHINYSCRKNCNNKNTITIDMMLQRQNFFMISTAIKKLLNNKDIIVILKQDKGRGVVMLNRSKYPEKCIFIVNSSQLLQVDKDRTAYTERKVQRTLREMKDKIRSLLYSKIYSTGSLPGKFYGNAKLHKVKDNQTVEDLPL